MTPDRFAPPSRRLTRVVERPRLLDALDGRFERRLTFLQAGAGFGKTTLLVDALDRNLEDAAGVDVWLALGPQDDRQGEFVAGLRRALGIEPGDNEDLEKIVNAVWKESPRDIALVLDDVHHLRAGGSGADFLERLLEALPANGHLVLASREAPSFPIARLIAAGEAAVIEEPDLAFDAVERAQFLGDRGVAQATNDWGGWPALLELAVTAGADRTGDFVWEEVLGRLPARTAKALARLAPLEWIDDARIEAVTGRAESVEALLESLPLVSLGQDGTARLHGLWRPFLTRLDPDWQPGEFEAALAHFCRTGEFREAMQLCRAFERGDRVVEVVSALAEVFKWSRLDATELEALIALLPESEIEAPAGLFLDSLLRLQTEPASAIAPLLRAHAGFREAGDVSLELAAVTAMGFVAFFGGQTEALRQIGALCETIDHPLQPIASALGRGTLATLESHPEDAIEIFESLSRSSEQLWNLDRSGAAIAAIDAGRPALALEHARIGLQTPTAMSRPSLLNSQYDALWFEGALDEAAVARYDGVLRADVGGHVHNTTTFHAVLAFQNAALGRSEPARIHRDQAERCFDVSLGARPAMALATARAACAVLDGDEAMAGKLLADALLEQPPESRVHRHSLRAVALIYVLLPDARAEVQRWKLGPCFQLGLEAAKALTSAREAGDLAPAARLDWTQSHRFRVFLTPGMALELAIAAMAEGRTEAESMARALAAQRRDELHRLAETEHKGAPETGKRRARVIKELLTRVPARPVGTTTIGVLGPLTLLRDDVPSEDATLRRSRVRALIEYLVAHRAARRVDVWTALWPAMDDTTAANNLRVNLSHLLRLLEPARKGNEPSYFFDLEGERIALRVGDGLVIDADRFEAELDTAGSFDREGRIGEALDAYRGALELYRGDYLQDASDPQWGELERTRLRSRYMTAGIRTASLLLGKDEFESALEITRDILAIDDLQNAAYRLQALVYFRRGDRSAARAVLRAGLDRLHEAGIEPDPELSRLMRRAGGR